jgi:hypothetical protein
LRIRIQFWIQGFDESKIVKNLKLKIFFYFFDQKLQLTYPLGPNKRTPKLLEKPSALKREHPAIQNMKLLHFFLYLWFFLPSWMRIRIQQIKLMRIRNPGGRRTDFALLSIFGGQTGRGDKSIFCLKGTVLPVTVIIMYSVAWTWIWEDKNDPKKKKGKKFHVLKCWMFSF